jgi:hypothetical protein
VIGPSNRDASPVGPPQPFFHTSARNGPTGCPCDVCHGITREVGDDGTVVISVTLWASAEVPL